MNSLMFILMLFNLIQLQVACCSAINFPRLIKFELNTFGSNSSKCSLELLMFLLHNSPILKELTITSVSNFLLVPRTFLNSVPGCLLSHLEIFVWGDFGGRRHERDFVAYILANSKCLKTARISPICYYNLEEKEKIAEDIKSMYRVSASSQLITH
ncbi:hypothetical protein F2Q69_00032008 [Brassica cretica]|uniref:FBD domain-containing protein n=1 Tax=Brassica cretica TaxID=69181 RepID=A0A8S9S9G5_BRACR|nr:hypothetical protein F2Q69_00032008 [Brassica cretica]